MILAIDIGNTTSAIYVLEPKISECVSLSNEIHIVFAGKVPTVKDQTPEKLMIDINNSGTFPKENDCFNMTVISSVVPELNEVFSDWAKAFTGLDPVFVKSENVPKELMAFDIPHPEKLGPDRICDALGAAAEYSLPLVTVDLGSATTFNVVDERSDSGNHMNKVFMGGIIAPGVRMGINALCTGTALLSLDNTEIPDHYIGKDTSECMLLGTIIGTAAMIDGMTEKIEKELGRKVSLIITGGNSSSVTPFITHDHVVDYELLIKGMCSLFTRL